MSNPTVTTGNTMDGIPNAPNRSIQHLIRRRNEQSRSSTSSSAVAGAAALAVDSKSPKPDDIPKIGLLYRTILHSPIVKWIIPARVRHISLNDVVFIGEDFIHIKQMLPTGELCHIASKTDLPGRIRSANIIGKHIEPEDPSQNPSSDPFLANSPPVKEESNPTPDTLHKPQVIPPHFIVLSLDEGHLMFLYVKWFPHHGVVEFHESRHPVPMDNSLARQPGCFIAVDRQKNLLAIAAHVNTIMIYRLKSWDQLNSEIDPSSFEDPNPLRLIHLEPQKDWSPISQEHAFRIDRTDPDTTILALSFLIHPDKTSSILVAIVRSSNRTKIFVYQTDESSNFDFNVPSINGQRLEEDASHPNLMIPFQHSPNFFLVFPTRFYVFTNVLTDSLQYAQQDIHPRTNESLQTRQPASSNEYPAYTSWAPAARSKKAKDSREHLFILREDGLLLMISEQSNSIQSLQLSVCARFECNGSSALAYLLPNNNLRDPDVLIAGGCVSDGQMIQLGGGKYDYWGDQKRKDVMKPNVLQIFPNWSPIIDFDLNHSESDGQPQLFLTTGRQPFSYVTEMRFGHDASVKSNAYFGDPNMKGATGIWRIAPAFLEDITIYFVSFPNYTEVFCLDQNEDEAVVLEALEDSTMTILHLGNDLVMQICSSRIRLFRVSYQDDASSDEIRLTSLLSSEHEHVETLVATCSVPGMDAAVLLAGQRTTQHLQIDLLGIQDETDSNWKLKSFPVLGNDIPNAMAAFHDPGYGHFVILGGSTGIMSVLRFTWDECVKIVDLGEDDGFTTMSKIVDSLIVLPAGKNAESHTYFILSGFRDGSVGLYTLRILGPATVKMTFIESVNIGQSAVTLHTDLESVELVVFAISGNSTFRILILPFGVSSCIIVANVWFNDSFNINFPQPLAPVMHVDSTFRDKRNSNRICSQITVFTSGNLFMARVDGERSQVPRKIPLLPWTDNDDLDSAPTTEKTGETEPGTPHLIMNLEDSDILAVATSRWELIPSPASSNTSPATQRNRNRQDRRLWRGVLHFVDKSVRYGGLEGREEDDGTNSNPVCVPFSPGERILAMCEWKAQVRNSSSGNIRYLLVGTSVPINDEGAREGKLYFMLPTIVDKKLREINVTTVKIVDTPVRALAPYDEFGIIVCKDDTMEIYGLIKLNNG
jgi:replication-dependent DNA damage repair protein MMS1